MVKPFAVPDNKWHRTDIRIRYKDTDRMGVVYYGNYLTFFEVARAEYMRSLGFPYSELEAKGYILAVTDASARYHGNVGYDALITVRTRISTLTRVQVRFEYQVVDSDDKLLVSGERGHACINEKMKACRMPEELLASLQEETLCGRSKGF